MQNDFKTTFNRPSPKGFRCIAVILLAFHVAFTQEPDPAIEEEAETVPAEKTALEPAPVQPKVAVAAAAIPKPMSLAQALSGSGLSSGCVDDFADIFGKSNFSMANFAKELVPEVAKVKLKLKSPFGKPNDGDRTNVGLTVGCIKSLPESPAAIQSLLKDVSLKAGLNFAAGAMDDYSIPSNVGNEGGSGGGTLKIVMSTLFIAGGLGAIVYGFMQDSEVKDAVKNWEGKAAVDAEKKRNICYGLGAGLLAGGLGVVIFF